MIDELATRLSGGRLITDPDVVDAYRRDHAHLVEPGVPLAVLLADTVEDVSVALAWAHQHGIPVVPRGTTGMPCWYAQARATETSSTVSANRTASGTPGSTRWAGSRRYASTTSGSVMSRPPLS